MGTLLHFPSSFFVYYLWSSTVCECARPVFSVPPCRRQASNLSVLLKTYIFLHRTHGSASRPPEPRGALVGGEEGDRGEDSRRREESEASFLPFPDSDRSTSRLVPLVQWSGTTGRPPCNWDSSFHTANGPGTRRQRRAQIPRLCVDSYLKPSEN